MSHKAAPENRPLTSAGARCCPTALPYTAAHEAVLVALAIVTLISSGRSAATFSQGNSPSTHTAWVAESLQKMETIKPGMTRSDLLTVFTTGGGIFSRTTRTYVSLDCPLFKVDVRFRPMGNTGTAESNEDIITAISRPYLQRQVVD